MNATPPSATLSPHAHTTADLLQISQVERVRTSA